MNNGWRTLSAAIGLSGLAVLIFAGAMAEKASKDSVVSVAESVDRNRQRIAATERCLHDMALAQAASDAELKRMVERLHADLRVLAAKQNIDLDN